MVRGVNLYLLGLIFFQLSSFGVGAMDSTDKVLRVFFPFKVLRTDAKLLDPSNTASVYEYYLLENLGVGLLRDDVSDLRGYSGLLATHWEQVSAKHWSFTLRKNLKWSDGSELSPDQILTHFQGLKNRQSRHLVNFQHLDRVSLGESGKTIHFRFKSATNQSFLHELALADAVLVHPDNLTKDWRKTSGHYSVESFDSNAKKLVLAANSFCPGYQSGGPRRVELFDVSSPAESSDLFEKVVTDIYSIPSLPFTPESKSLVARAKGRLLGQPNLIYFWKFNPINPLTTNLDARRELASLISETFRDFKSGEEAGYYSQLVSPGYSGALSKFDVPNTKTSVLKGKTILLRFRPPFEYLTNELNVLRSGALKRGITLKLAFDAFTPGEVADPDEFARVQGFKGNQKDAVGSWSFLFTAGKGDLGPFREQGKPLLNKVLEADSDDLKSQHLKTLHQFTLENAFAVPFLNHREQILISDRVDLKRWNRFDLRLRFYDVLWIK